VLHAETLISEILESKRPRFKVIQSLKLSKAGSFETKNVVEGFSKSASHYPAGVAFSVHDNIDDYDNDLSCGCSHIFSEYKYRSTFPSPYFTSGFNPGMMTDV